MREIGNKRLPVASLLSLAAVSRDSDFSLQPQEQTGLHQLQTQFQTQFQTGVEGITLRMEGKNSDEENKDGSENNDENSDQLAKLLGKFALGTKRTKETSTFLKDSTIVVKAGPTPQSLAALTDQLTKMEINVTGSDGDFEEDGQADNETTIKSRKTKIPKKKLPPPPQSTSVNVLQTNINTSNSMQNTGMMQDTGIIMENSTSNQIDSGINPMPDLGSMQLTDPFESMNALRKKLFDALNSFDVHTGNDTSEAQERRFWLLEHVPKGQEQYFEGEFRKLFQKTGPNQRRQDLPWFVRQLYPEANFDFQKDWDKTVDPRIGKGSSPQTIIMTKLLQKIPNAPVELRVGFRRRRGSQLKDAVVRLGQFSKKSPQQQEDQLEGLGLLLFLDCGFGQMNEGFFSFSKAENDGKLKLGQKFFADYAPWQARKIPQIYRGGFGELGLLEGFGTQSTFGFKGFGDSAAHQSWSYWKGGMPGLRPVDSLGAVVEQFELTNAYKALFVEVPNPDRILFGGPQNAPQAYHSKMVAGHKNKYPLLRDVAEFFAGIERKKIYMDLYFTQAASEGNGYPFVKRGLWQTGKGNENIVSIKEFFDALIRGGKIEGKELIFRINTSFAGTWSEGLRKLVLKKAGDEEKYTDWWKASKIKEVTVVTASDDKHEIPCKVEELKASWDSEDAWVKKYGRTVYNTSRSMERRHGVLSTEPAQGDPKTAVIPTPRF